MKAPKSHVLTSACTYMQLTIKVCDIFLSVRPKMALNIDRVFSEIGDFGPGQRGYTFVLCLFNCYGAWHMMLYAFIAFKVGFQCQPRDPQDSPGYNQCPANKLENCEEIKFDTEDQSTIISEWTLVCDEVGMLP